VSQFVDGFLDDYFAECDEHLTTVRRGLLALEGSVGRRRPDPAVTEELFRTFHTIKGIAGMVEHRETEQLAHEMETYLRAIREGDARLTTHGIEVLIEGARLLEHTIAARRNVEAAPDTSRTVAGLRGLISETHEAQPASEANGAPEDGPALPSWECIFTPSPSLVARGVNVDSVRSRLRDAGEIISATPLVTDHGAVAFRFLFTGEPDRATLDTWAADGMICVPLTPSQAALNVHGESHDVVDADRASTTLSSGHYVRVDLTRLDELMRMIGDLVILRVRLADSIQRVEPHVPAQGWRNIQEHTAAIERQLRELREGVMRVRLVRVGEIFRRMPFVVRDLARDTGRRVRVALAGQDTEIDKFLVERMMDPVLHLVRNAVSHGIESVDERIAAGKPPEGTISLSAAAAGEIVTIDISDDGRGVDTERVLARAARRGLPVPLNVDDAALLDLISSPGFSTRDESDRASGRGFGMAVVRKAVQELGGVMRMTSTPGTGTRFSVDLPLTLAITDALIARVGGQMFAVPQSTVREVVEIESSAVRALESGEVAPYRGSALPVIRLSSMLGIPQSTDGRFHAFVIGTGASAVGLLADRIVGQREIVVRAIADPLIRVEGVSGATDLGDGRAVLILDTAAIARLVRARRSADDRRSKEIA
jgi:two-component system chemotaxis sensor kinase CheA